jgi:hypothetical protein
MNSITTIKLVRSSKQDIANFDKEKSNDAIIRIPLNEESCYKGGQIIFATNE